MKLKTIKIFFISCLILSIVVIAAAYHRYVYNKPYNLLANSKAEISNSLKSLKDNQILAIVLGANWCPECLKLAKDLESPPLNGIINKSFSVVKVDVNGWDRNMDIVELLGNPVKGGIPAIVFLNNQKQIILTNTGNQLSKLKNKYGSYYQYFVNVDNSYIEKNTVLINKSAPINL